MIPNVEANQNASMEDDLQAGLLNEASTCQYYTMESFRSGVQTTGKLLILHLNVRSFFQNFEEFNAYFSQLECKPQVMVLSETWFNDFTVASLDGYLGYHSARDERRGGGVSVYVQDSITSAAISQLSLSGPVFECVAVKLTVSNGENICVVGIYRHPVRHNILSFTDSLANILNTFSNNQSVFLVGDVNIDLLQLDNQNTEYYSLLRAMSYVPIITKATRVTGNSATLVDHIWTNMLVNIESGVFEVNITDHYPIIACIDMPVNREHHYVRKFFRDHSCEAISCMRHTLSHFLNTVFTTFNEMDICDKVRIFHNQMYSIYNVACKLQSKNIPYNKFTKPWITNDIISYIDRKHILFRQYRRGYITFNEYNNYKNMCTMLLKQAKVSYFKLKFDAAVGDIKKTWKNLKYLINFNKQKDRIAEIKTDTETLTEPLNVADAFNAHYCTVAEKLDGEIPMSNKSALHYMGTSLGNSFFVSPCTGGEVKNIINSFATKGCSLSEVPVYVYKQMSNIVCDTIAQLFNDSVQNGQFPECLKTARVIPVYKGGDKSKVINYRPISTLPFLAKLFERLMYKRLVSFLNANDVLYSKQFGFRSKSCTADAILEFTDFAYSVLQSKEYLLTVYLDFSKAFDTVNRTILTKKLHHIGIRGRGLDWFSSYLDSRRQYVSINQSHSHVREINMGVPQGSILGPVLFLIYINDMHKSSSVLKFIHFADDTTVFAAGSNLRELSRLINRELINVDNWLRINRLSLNVKKTFCMTITNQSTADARTLYMRRKIIKQTNTVKFLGVMLDDRLSFTSHVSHIVKKISRVIGMLYRVCHCIPHKQMKNLYYSLIYPHIMYCIPVWGRASVGGLKTVQRVQRRALKLVYGRDGYIPDNCAVLNVDSMYAYFAAIKLHQILGSDNHTYFNFRIAENQVQHIHDTRFRVNQNLLPPFYRTNRCQSSFLYQSIAVWNNLPRSIKGVQSLKQFKLLLKSYLNEQQAIKGRAGIDPFRV